MQRGFNLFGINFALVVLLSNYRTCCSLKGTAAGKFHIAGIEEQLIRNLSQKGFASLLAT